MADGILLNSNTSSGATLATDDAGAAGHVQVVKLAISTDGSATALQADNTNGLLADVKRVQGTVTVQGTAADGATASGNPVLVAGFDGTNVQTIATTSGGLVQVHDGAGSLTVDNGGTFAVQSTVADGANVTLGARADAKSTATDTTAVTIMSVLKQVSASVQAAAASLAGTLTVATHAVTQSGTWTVQPGNTANTTAWKVDASAVAVPITDNSGSLTVDGTVSVNTHSIDSVTTSVTPGTSAAHLGKAEDAAHSSGDTGVMALAVRKDSQAALAGTDGDYIPLTTDANGALYVTGGGGGTQYDEDAASAGAEKLTLAGAVRRDAAASSSGTDGDYSTLNTDASGRLWVNASGAAVPVTDNAGSLTVDAPVGTPAFVRLSDGSAAITTLPVSLASVPSHAVTVASGGIASGGIASGAIADMIVDDAAFTPATTRVLMAGFEADESSTDSVDEGDGGAARMTLDRKVIVTPQPHTAGGLSSYSALSTAAVLTAQIKGAAGQFYEVELFNKGSAAVYVRLYDQTGAPASTDGANIVWRGIVPGATTGAGFVRLAAHGRVCATGIGIRVSGAIADNDTTALNANEVTVNVGYK